MTTFLASPAAVLVVIIIAAIILAVLAAKLTARPQSDNGLRYEYQIRQTGRKQ